MPNALKTAIATAIVGAASILAPLASAAQVASASAAAVAGAPAPTSVSIAYGAGIADMPVAIMAALRLVERQAELVGAPGLSVKYLLMGSLGEAGDELAAGRADFASMGVDRLIAAHGASRGDVRAAGGMLATSTPVAATTLTFLAGSGRWAKAHPAAAEAVARALAQAEVIIRAQPMMMSIVLAAGGRPGISACEAAMLLQTSTLAFDVVPRGLGFYSRAMWRAGEADRAFEWTDLVLPWLANASGG